jgi:hypothetical protein
MEFGDLTPPGYDHLDAGIRPSNGNNGRLS